MARLFKVLILLVISAPLGAFAEVRSGDLPAGTRWYLNVDLKQMRESDSGRELFNWLDGEVFVEIHEEIGVDIGKETDRFTAFSGTDRGTVILVEGDITEESRNKLLAVAAVQAKLDTLAHKGKTYYRVEDTDGKHRAARHEGRNNIAFDGMEDEAFFSFAVRNKLIVTSTAESMQALLDAGGKVAGSGAHTGALFVLTADKTFVQAGLKTDDLDDGDEGWKSNIVRNTEQINLLVSENKDLIAVTAELVSTDPRMAQSIGAIVNGLVSLQAFNTELDPEVLAIIQNTRIEVKEKVLSISTVISPKTVVQALNN